MRHTDGGYYRVVTMARHTDDQTPLVVYQHLWPFEPVGEPWARPAHEWPSRFVPVSEDELQAAMCGDRQAAHAAVTAAKAARRAAEGR